MKWVISLREKFIHFKADEFLQDFLFDVVYAYVSGTDFQRISDSFRGSLVTCFKFDFISLDNFIFLTNFLSWLDCKTGFSEIDQDTFQNFYDGYIQDMDTHFNK